MITAYLVGDEQLLERLHTLPGAINSGLVRGVTRLGISLQRALQQDNIDGGRPTSRTAPLISNPDLRLERSDGTIAARIRFGFDNVVRKDGLAGTTNGRTSLRRERRTFISPSARNVISTSAGDGRSGFAEPSFLRSTLDNMTSAVHDEIDATLAQAVSQ